MNSDALLQKNRGKIVAIATQHGAQTIRVFGSRRHGVSHEGSDLDLLVTMESGRTLLDLIAIKQDLEDVLGCSVDVVTEASLSPYIREDVLNEAIAI